MKRITIAKILAVAASVMSAISIYYMCASTEIPDLAGMGLIISPMLAFVSYCLCGFFKALGTPFSFVKLGLVVAPFPGNLAAVLILFVVGIFPLSSSLWFLCSRERRNWAAD